MSLKWADVYEIAIELADAFPDSDPKYINFVDLRAYVLGLDEFDDNPDYCGEKILEAIQMAWIDEVE